MSRSEPEYIAKPGYEGVIESTLKNAPLKLVMGVSALFSTLIPYIFSETVHILEVFGYNGLLDEARFTAGFFFIFFLLPLLYLVFRAVNLSLIWVWIWMTVICILVMILTQLDPMLLWICFIGTAGAILVAGVILFIVKFPSRIERAGSTSSRFVSLAWLQSGIRSLYQSLKQTFKSRKEVRRFSWQYSNPVSLSRTGRIQAILEVFILLLLAGLVAFMMIRTFSEIPSSEFQPKQLVEDFQVIFGSTKDNNHRYPSEVEHVKKHHAEALEHFESSRTQLNNMILGNVDPYILNHSIEKVQIINRWSKTLQAYQFIFADTTRTGDPNNLLSLTGSEPIDSLSRILYTAWSPTALYEAAAENPEADSLLQEEISRHHTMLDSLSGLTTDSTHLDSLRSELLSGLSSRLDSLPRRLSQPDPFLLLLKGSALKDTTGSFHDWVEGNNRQLESYLSDTRLDSGWVLLKQELNDYDARLADPALLQQTGRRSANIRNLLSEKLELEQLATIYRTARVREYGRVDSALVGYVNNLNTFYATLYGYTQNRQATFFKKVQTYGGLLFVVWAILLLVIWLIVQMFKLTIRQERMDLYFFGCSMLILLLVPLLQPIKTEQINIDEPLESLTLSNWFFPRFLQRNIIDPLQSSQPADLARNRAVRGTGPVYIAPGLEDLDLDEIIGKLDSLSRDLAEVEQKVDEILVVPPP